MLQLQKQTYHISMYVLTTLPCAAHTHIVMLVYICIHVWLMAIGLLWLVGSLTAENQNTGWLVGYYVCVYVCTTTISK